MNKKRILFLFSAIALLIACDNAEEMEPAQGGGALNSELPEIVHASVADKKESADSTRTYVTNDEDILWHNGDAISYFTGESHAHYVFNGKDGAENATFEQNGSLSITSVTGSFAVYPFSESNACDASGKLSVVYPTEQTYAPNSFGKGANLMVAASETSNADNLKFRNACGYLVIKLYGKGIEVAEIKLTALGDGVKIAGAASITTNGEGVPTFTMGDDASSEVTLDCSNGGHCVALNAETATEFWFALPAVTMEGGMKILVTATDNRTFEKQTTNTVAIERAKVQPMAALQFESNVSTPYQLFYTTEDGAKLDLEGLELDPFDAEIASHTYSNGQGVITFKTPLTTIKANGFGNPSVYTPLSTITIPESVTTIGNHAFYNSYLSDITIPGTIIKTFCGCVKPCTRMTILPYHCHIDLANKQYF